MSRPRPPARHRSRLFLFAFALAAIAQMLVLTLSPYGDSHEGQSARAHVEPFGTSQHYAHNPDNCASCVAQHIGGELPPPARLVPRVATQPALRPAAPRLARRTARLATASPRAPPADARPV